MATAAPVVPKEIPLVASLAELAEWVIACIHDLRCCATLFKHVSVGRQNHERKLVSKEVLVTCVLINPFTCWTTWLPAQCILYIMNLGVSVFDSNGIA